MNLWHMMTTAYSLSLRQRPMLTEMTTSGALWCLGDLATQHMERSRRQDIPGHTTNSNNNSNNSSSIDDDAIDWKRSFHQTVYASLIWGPVAHKWYHALDRVAQSIVPRKRPSRHLATKLCLEMGCLQPVSLLAYFSVTGLLNGESFSSIASQLKRDFVPTCMLEIAFWTPVDILIFSVVPVKHQLLAVNCGCFLESIGLSFIRNNGFDAVKQQFSFLAKHDQEAFPVAVASLEGTEQRKLA